MEEATFDQLMAPFEEQGDDDFALHIRDKFAAWIDEGCSVVVYRNEDLGHHDVGGLQYLKVGPGCTHTEPPKQMPDHAQLGFGWRYQPYQIVTRR